MPILWTQHLAATLPRFNLLHLQTIGEKMSLSGHMKREPKELAQFASDAYQIGIADTMTHIRVHYPELNPARLNQIEEQLRGIAFEAVQWRKNVEWVEGIDHSMSPSKTYVSMPIERYNQLRDLEVK